MIMLMDIIDGKKGQIKLKNTSILIVGAGGLGAPAAIYLTSAGVGSVIHLISSNYDFPID